MITYSWYQCHVSNIQHLIMASCENSLAQPVGFAHFVKMQLTNLSWSSSAKESSASLFWFWEDQHSYKSPVYSTPSYPRLHWRSSSPSSVFHTYLYPATILQHSLRDPEDFPGRMRYKKKLLQQVDPEVSSQLDVPRTPPQGAPMRNPNIML